MTERDDLLRAIFASSPIAMTVLGTHGRPLCANPALCRMLGYSEEELLTMTFADLTHPSDLDLDVGLFEELRAGKRESYSLEKRYIRKDRRVHRAKIVVSMERSSEVVVVTAEDLSGEA